MEAATVRLSTTVQAVAAGETFTVDVILDPASSGVSAFDVTLTFDPAIVTVSQLALGDIFGANGITAITTIDSTAGTARVVGVRAGATSGATAPGTIVRVEATAVVAVADAAKALTISAISVTDANFAFLTELQIVGE